MKEQLLQIADYIAALEQRIAALEARVEELENREPEVEVDFEFDEPEPEPVIEEPVAEEPVIEEPIIEEPVAEPEPIVEPEPEPIVEPEPEPIVEPEPEPIVEPELPVHHGPVQTSLFGAPVNDIRHAISLGDRFLFQRELFAGNGEKMQKTLDEINALRSYKDAVAYIERFGWDKESSTYELFLNVLRRRF